MFQITIPTLVTEEVYQRFAWSVFLTREKIFAKYYHFNRNPGSLSNLLT